MLAINNPLPTGSVSGRESLFFCLGVPAEGFGSLYLYVSIYCFLTCLRFLSWVLGGGGTFPMDSGCLIFPMKR